MDLSLPEALKGPPPEVLPSHYLVVENRATQNREPRLVGKFDSLADAHDAILTGGKKKFLSILAHYPDKSVKTLYDTGNPSGGYGMYSNKREPYGHHTEHTPELETYAGAKPQAHADAALVSEHHYADLVNHHIATLVLRGGRSPYKDNPIGTEPHKFIQQALATGDHTPLLAMADYLDEQGHSSLAGMVRKAIEKKQEKVDDLRWRRTLRTGGR